MTNRETSFIRRAKLQAHSILRRLGVDVRRYPAPSEHSWRRRELLQTHRIDLVLDVGANAGQYGCELRRCGFAGRIVSFEPLTEAFEKLRQQAEADANWECRRVALGTVDGMTELNVAANSYSSSLLPICDRHVAAEPNSAFVSRQTVPVARLDSLQSAVVKPGDRVWLKLDVQGYEAEVLRGATGTLAQTWVVDCELSLAPLYEGQRLFQGMLDDFESLGFVLIALDPAFADPRSGRLLQLDGLFVRSPSPTNGAAPRLASL